MPEVPGCLEAGGFLLIHYDIWRRKMKNLTPNKRFMMKFEFVRMHEPEAPTWDYVASTWKLDDKPAVDMAAVWRRQWDWLCHARPKVAPVDAGIDVAAGLAATEVDTVLATLNAIARDAGVARTHLDTLLGLLEHPFDPVALDAGYVFAAVGDLAVLGLTSVILARDGDHVAEKSSAQQSLDYIPNEERIARAAIIGLIEIGAASVPALLEILAQGQSHARKLAAFALGEVGVATEMVLQALCAAASNAEPAVRVNAVESLGMVPATLKPRCASRPRCRLPSSVPTPKRRCRPWPRHCTTATATCLATPSRHWRGSAHPKRRARSCHS